MASLLSISNFLYILIYAGLGILILYKSRFVGFGKDKFNDDFLPVEASSALKGILAITIIMHHLSLCYSNDKLMVPFMQFGKLAVALFFLISGYGLMYSYIHKKDYMKGFIKKRFSKIIIPVVIATIAYIVFYLITDKKLSFNILNLITGKETIIMYSWFIYQIIIVYIAYFLSFRFIKRVGIATAVFSAILLADAVLFVAAGYDVHWSIGILCTPVGLLLAIYHDKILQLFKKHYYKCFAVSIVGFVLVFAVVLILQNIESRSIGLNLLEAMIHNVSCTFFCILVLLVLLKLSISNKATKLLGGISFEIYMYHGICLTLFADVDMKFHPVNWLVVIIASVLLAFAFGKINGCVYHIKNKLSSTAENK